MQLPMELKVRIAEDLLQSDHQAFCNLTFTSDHWTSVCAAVIRHKVERAYVRMRDTILWNADIFWHERQMQVKRRDPIVVLIGAPAI